MTTELGEQLKSVRQVKGMSLRQVATPSEISVAYLQKLERGDVGQPSPNVLFRISKVLDVPYDILMLLAGYEPIAPTEDEALLGSQAAASRTFGRALESTDLTEAERKAVAAFIAHLRQQRNNDAQR